MSVARLRSVFSWLAPGGLVTLAALAAVRLATDLAPVAGLVRVSLFAAYIAAVILAWRFHRSRVVAALAALVIVEQLLRRTSGPDAQVVYAAAAFLLPATIAFLTLTIDRGVLSLRGAAQLGAVLIQPLAVSLLLEFQADRVQRFLFLNLVDPGLTAWTRIPQPALLAYAIAVALVLLLAIRRASPVEKGLLWFLAATFLGFGAGPGAAGAATAVTSFSAASAVFLLAAALTLGLSVVEISYGMAYRDELTGLPARRALREALAALGSRYTIAMVDVDRFKRVNDRHGHDVGDQVLRMVAARLKRVSGGGRAFRYGGEEFAVIFAGKSREEAAPHLEKLRAKVEAYRFALRGRWRPRKRPRRRRSGAGSRRRQDGRSLAVTVSVGLAERGEKQTSADEVLEAADKALYRAKRAGRNRVC